MKIKNYLRYLIIIVSVLMTGVAFINMYKVSLLYDFYIIIKFSLNVNMIT